MSEGANFSARCRIRIFAPEQFFGYFLFAQKVTRRQANPDGSAGASGDFEKGFFLFSKEKKCPGSLRGTSHFPFCFLMTFMRTNSSRSFSSSASLMTRMVLSKSGMTIFFRAFARFWDFLMA